MAALGDLLNELSRHAPLGRTRRRPARDGLTGQPPTLAQRRRRQIADIYLADRAEARRGGRFRWFFSTCLAASVGALTIAAVVLGSMDSKDGASTMPELRRAAAPLATTRLQQPSDGLSWSTPKADRLQTAAGAMLAKYVVQESVNQRRGNREYMYQKYYARIAIRLAAVPASAAQNVPPFNPVKLYGGSAAGEGPEGDREPGRGEGGEVALRVVELLGSILPTEDGQELDDQEAAELVSRAVFASDAAMRPGFLPEGAESPAGRGGDRHRASPIPITPNTSVIEKVISDYDEDLGEAEARHVKVKVARGETLSKILERMGADPWQAREMADKARSLLPEAMFVPGLDLELALVPSLTDPQKSEPSRVSIFSGSEHKVTVRRNAAGEFVAQAEPMSDRTRGRPETADETHGSATNLYASFYHAASVQGLPPELIQQVLRIHAYETDYRRRARGSDGIDLFLDLRDEGKAADNPPAELLSTALTVGGDTQRYYRFRTPDGVIDYYDEDGNNSRKFLMRKPIRSEEVRFMSGFGMRRHPLLGVVRMHTGVDWAGPLGTPIVASGNGVIEEAGYKGQNGYYVRIRHANGYQTAYSHMQSRFPPDIREGAKVRQGQVIGYLGNTGLSTGPHLHFEILVSNRFVDPMSLHVPKERKLTGKILADFQRERARIDDLMRRPPVRVAQIDARP